MGPRRREDPGLNPGPELLERIWPGGIESVAPLGGGLTNHNFKVVAEGEAFVLRVGGADTELLGIDRRAEHRASVEAHRLEIGPEVVTFLEPEQCLVTRFVDGEVGRVSVAEAAELLQRLHDGRPIDGSFDVFQVVEDYAAIARAHDVHIPSTYEHVEPVVAHIRRRRGAPRLVPCHNDLLAANFIHDGERAWIVDWEYAGMGDPAFDLANFAAGNRLDADAEAELLATYGADAETQVLMRFMSDLREAMWGVVQLALSELDFDFATYAEEHFARLEDALASHRLRALLDL